MMTTVTQTLGGARLDDSVVSSQRREAGFTVRGWDGSEWRSDRPCQGSGQHLRWRHGPRPASLAVGGVDARTNLDATHHGASSPILHLLHPTTHRARCVCVYPRRVSRRCDALHSLSPPFPFSCYRVSTLLAPTPQPPPPLTHGPSRRVGVALLDQAMREVFPTSA